MSCCHSHSDPNSGVDAVEEMHLQLILHCGAVGVTQSDGREFMWDIKPMGFMDSALDLTLLGLSSQSYLGVHPEPDSKEYSRAVFLRIHQTFILFLHTVAFS